MIPSLRFRALAPLLLGSLMIVAGPAARADLYPNFTLAANLAAVGAAQVSSAIQTIALAGDHRAYMPATGTGLPGFDLGLEATGFLPPAAFSNALQAMTGQAAPGVLLIPKINVHKGLPGGLDIGGSGIYYYLASSQQSLFLIGGDVKWTFFSGPALPSLAVRGSFNYTNLWFITGMAYDLDAVVSYPMVIIDPYIGAGATFWTGNLSVPVGSGITVATSANGLNPRIYAGLPLKMGILRLTAQAEYSFSGLLTFGGKISFGWN